MTSGFKKPGILRASFDYQDLVAISILIDFYRAPDQYEWIELDSDDPQHASIDDIVARRADGTFEITQVKFTVDPDDAANQLSWSWLLRRSKAGRSLLEKWTATVARHAAAGTLHSARLYTDRRPDPMFAQCLVKNRIDPGKLPIALLTQIDQQVPDATHRAAFFKHFIFQHSQKQLSDLEYDLQTKLIPSDTNYDGWIGLARGVKEWATHKNRPEPDGRVRHGHVRAKISRERPRPLLQSFEVPADYQPPDGGFDLAFQARLQGEDGVTVLWGTPGRGKSTYLSHCFAQLRADDQICIRHHYFLSLAERGTDRFFFQEIERSLIRQLEEQLPDLAVKGQDLSKWLDAAAEQAGRLNRRLIIFIDGLDHVWREERSLDHMQQLFTHLLPARDYMHLVVGTQRIANRHLPRPLLKFTPDDGWVELPLMSVEAIAHWLDVQLQAGRFRLAPRHQADATLLKLAHAFHNATGGLPLQLIYTFETLARSGAELTEDAVRGLPQSPTGDIRDYYRGLWTGISPAARNVLHGLASIDFAMPPGSLPQCFDQGGDTLEEIDHLLDHQETGISPFHGSIFVFVREQADHGTAAIALQPAIRAWLSGPAPAYWKWAWTWLTEARFGNPVPLLTGPDRGWVIAALCTACPPDQIERILQEAEEAAFRMLDFPRAHELRALRIRTANAPEFQTNKFDDFVEASLRLATQDFRLLHLRNALPSQTPGTMLALLRTLAPEAAAVTATAVLDELNRRIRAADRQDNANTDWPASVVRILPYVESFEPKRLRDYARRAGREDELIAATIEESIISRRYAPGYRFASIQRGNKCDKSLFALLCLDGVDPRRREELKGPPRHMRDLLFAVKGWPIGRSRSLMIDAAAMFPAKRELDEQMRAQLRLHEFFFRVASAALGGRADRIRLNGLDQVGDDWFEGMLGKYAKAALALAARIDCGESPPTVADFYQSLGVEAHSDKGVDRARQMGGVRVATAEIAINLQLLRQAHDPRATIGAGELPTTAQSWLWHDDIWLGPSVDRRLPLHSPLAASEFLDRIWARVEREVIEFMERADLLIDAAIFALENGLADRAASFLERAARCLLGYGWRKDPFAFDILDSLERLAEVDAAWAAQQLRRVAPQFEAITEYTDGDETNHARSDFHALVAKLIPDRVGPLYGELIRADDWYYAERLLEDCAKNLDPADPQDAALLRTFIQPSELGAVRQLAARRGRGGTVLVEYLERLVGHSRAAEPHDSGSSSSRLSRNRPASAPKPDAYPPGTLRAFLAAVQNAPGFGWKDKAVERWLSCWAAAKHGAEALAELKAVSEEGSSSYVLDTVYDQAFKLSLVLEGRESAFYWLVTAQRNRYGWGRWYTSGREAENRLALAAKHYRSEWARFVLESGAPAIRNAGERGSIVMGQSRLVSFLLKVGETDRARDYAAAMIDTLIEEVADQPLPTPGWLA